MKWKKLGLIFCADNQSSEMHCQGRTPVPLLIEDDIVKVYFGSLDLKGIGRIFNLKINIKNPTKPFDINSKSIIDIGDFGFFDDNGIIPSSILKVKDKLYLYTIGFSVKNQIMFEANGGLAISSDNGDSFEKFEGPIVNQSIYDPCFSSNPFVMFDDNIFKMWYVSGVNWKTLKDGSLKHYYNIKYKESDDGIHWGVQSQVAIDFKNEYEYAIASPAVVRDGPNDYKMWYSYRAQKNIDTYRMGYAESIDGISWIRKDDKVGIDVSKSGWDREMICYPYVFDYKGLRYMLYNGNGYGKTGFGLAVLES